MVGLYLYGLTDRLLSKYYPTNTFHGFPLALGTYACACFWPLLLVLLAHTGTQNHHQKKQRCRYFCAPHTNIILPDASSPSFFHLSPPSPLSFPSLSFPSLSFHTRAPILTLGVRDKLQRASSSSSSHLFYSRYYWDSVLSDSSSTKLSQTSKTSKEDCLIYERTHYGQNDGPPTKQEITFRSILCSRTLNTRNSLFNHSSSNRTTTLDLSKLRKPTQHTTTTNERTKLHTPTTTHEEKRHTGPPTRHTPCL